MLLALPCVLPLLEFVNDLKKFAQSRDVFISNYMAAVKICQVDLYMMYVDPESSFQKAQFQMFCNVVEDHSYTISQEWVTDMNMGIESLAFIILGQTYPVHILCPASGKKLSVSRCELEWEPNVVLDNNSNGEDRNGKGDDSNKENEVLIEAKCGE